MYVSLYCFSDQLKLILSRVFGKNFNKGKLRHMNMMVSSDSMLNVGARPKKVGKLQKLDTHASDGDKYMSFIKVRQSLSNC